VIDVVTCCVPARDNHEQCTQVSGQCAAHHGHEPGLLMSVVLGVGKGVGVGVSCNKLGNLERASNTQLAAASTRLSVRASTARMAERASKLTLILSAG
jgi:hypothetical protein